MPKKTIAQRLTKALEARGYKVTPNARGSRFIEFRLTPDGRSLLKPGYEDHRVLVGSHGALRFTTMSIAKSVPFSERVIQRLIQEHEGASS